MSKVAKGILIGGAIVLTGGAVFGVAAVAGASAATLGGIYTLTMALSTSAFLNGVSAQLAGRRQPRPREDVEYAGTLEPRRIIFGQRLVSGMHTIPPWTSGTNNKYLHSVLTIAGHQCEAIPTIYLDGEAVGTITSISGNADDGKVTSGTFDDVAWLRRYLGTSSQTADYILNTAFTDWTSDHEGLGVTYIAAQFELDSEKFKNGRPEISALVQGHLCYDPRLDSTNGGTGSHRYDDATTWEYSTNAALCTSTYLMVYVGVLPAKIDWTMLAAAADICDETVTVPSVWLHSGTTQTRYTCNLTLYIDPADKLAHIRNLELLTGCMLGSCLPSGGKWRIRAGAWETPSFEITADNVMGDLELQIGYSFNERWNGVNGTFIDPNNKYLELPFPSVQDGDYVTADGESVFREVSFPGCTHVFEAIRNGIVLVRKSRNKELTTVLCDMSLFDVRPGDTGIATIEELGWSSQQVRCEGWAFASEGRVALTLRAESATDWDDPDSGDYTTPDEISTPAPGYFTPAAPSSLTATGTPRAITFTWTPPALVPAGAQAVLYEYTSSTPFASASEVWRGRGTTCTISKSDTTTRYYWLRYEMQDGTAGTEYPTSTSGVAGTAVPSTMLYSATDNGPTQLASHSSIAPSTQYDITGVVLSGGEYVEIAVAANLEVDLDDGFTNSTQFSAGYYDGSTHVYAGSAIKKIGTGVESMTAVATVGPLSAGTYSFGYRCKFTQIPSGPPYITATFTNVSIKATVITL